MKGFYKISLKSIQIILPVIYLAIFTSCGNSKTQSQEDENAKKEELTPEVLAKLRSYKGVGPITLVELSENIDMNMAYQGKGVFMTMCTSCHKPDEEFIGPSPKGVLERRSPEWVMNKILNPEGMIKNDSIARALYEQYNRSPMANQLLSEKQARQVLEYFRTL